MGGDKVLLQVSAFSKQCAASVQEQGGCPGFDGISRQVLPGSQTDEFGAFAEHSQEEGVIVVLQLSALSKQWDVSKHEHPGCPGSSVTFKQNLLSSQVEKVGPLKLQPHIAGTDVELQLLALSKH